MIPRYCTSASSAAAITFALLLLMQLLIATGRNPLVDDPWNVIPPVLLLPPTDPPEAAPEPLEPPRPVEPRPADMPNMAPGSRGGIATGSSPSHGPIDPGIVVGLPEGHAILLIAVQPVYPQSLLRRGIEGHVVVEFTVTAEGTVANVIVLESSHRGFEANAIQAAERMKFKPRVVSGKPIPVSGVRKMFRFEIEG